MELMGMPTRRPQESFSLPGRKLKPRRGTMLLLPVEKVVSLDLLFFLCLSFLREQATRQGANQLKTRSLPTLTHVLPPILKLAPFPTRSLLYLLCRFSQPLHSTCRFCSSTSLIPSAPFTSGEDTGVGFGDRKPLTVDGNKNLSML